MTLNLALPVFMIIMRLLSYHLSYFELFCTFYYFFFQILYFLIFFYTVYSIFRFSVGLLDPSKSWQKAHNIRNFRSIIAFVRNQIASKSTCWGTWFWKLEVTKITLGPLCSLYNSKCKSKLELFNIWWVISLILWSLNFADFLDKS